MYRVVPAAAVTTHAKPHAQQQIARDLEVDYENLLTNVRGPPDKYGMLTHDVLLCKRNPVALHIVPPPGGTQERHVALHTECIQQ